MRYTNPRLLYFTLLFILYLCKNFGDFCLISWTRTLCPPPRLAQNPGDATALVSPSSCGINVEASPSHIFTVRDWYRWSPLSHILTVTQPWRETQRRCSYSVINHAPAHTPAHLLNPDHLRHRDVSVRVAQITDKQIFFNNQNSVC